MHVARALLPYCVAGTFAVAAPAQARDDCKPVGFAPGQTTMELAGTAPPGDVVCFALTGLRGQSVSITVTEGANIIFSIEQLVDARDRYRFTATRPTYRILVGQLMRSIEAAPFRIRVALGDARGADPNGTRKVDRISADDLRRSRARAISSHRMARPDSRRLGLIADSACRQVPSQ